MNNDIVRRTANVDKREIRSLEVAKLRVEGLTYAEIASSLGICEGTAKNDFTRVLERTRSEAKLDIEQARTLEVAQCDLFTAKVLSIINDPTADPEIVMKAIDRGLKVSERRAKLLGLDAPERKEVAATVIDPSESTPERARHLMSELFPAISGNESNRQ